MVEVLYFNFSRSLSSFCLSSLTVLSMGLEKRVVEEREHWIRFLIRSSPDHQEYSPFVRLFLVLGFSWRPQMSGTSQHGSLASVLLSFDSCRRWCQVDHQTFKSLRISPEISILTVFITALWQVSCTFKDYMIRPSISHWHLRKIHDFREFNAFLSLFIWRP